MILLHFVVLTSSLAYAHKNDKSIAMVDFSKLDIIKELGHLDASGRMLDLPHSFFCNISYQRDDEPEFDPDIHLAPIEPPAYVTFLDDFLSHSILDVSKVNSSAGSNLAYTAPFQLFSKEGVHVLRSIIEREKHRAHRNRRNVELRGLYYHSPFVRNMLTHPTFLKIFEKATGEPVWPHFLLMDAVSVNIAGPSDNTKIEGVADPWHFDSVTYVGVALLSDMEGMIGGELQLIKKRKEQGLKIIEATGNQIPPEDLLTVSYERQGACILVQGSEVFHRVTKVKASREPRISLVLAFHSANPFQPDKTVLDTHENFDADTGSAPFEFYRVKAHLMSQALESLVRDEPHTTSRHQLAMNLHVIAQEIDRAAFLLNMSISDYVGFVNETIYANITTVSDTEPEPERAEKRESKWREVHTLLLLLIAILVNYLLLPNLNYDKDYLNLNLNLWTAVSPFIMPCEDDCHSYLDDTNLITGDKVRSRRNSSAAEKYLDLAVAYGSLLGGTGGSGCPTLQNRSRSNSRLHETVDYCVGRSRTLTL